jgi:hypothetical protein
MVEQTVKGKGEKDISGVVTAVGGRPARISILGSCVSRDSFSALSRMKAHAELSLYYARTSIISLMSERFVEPENYGEDRGFETKCVQRDLRKTFFTDFAQAAPEILVLDFIDERFTIGRLGDRWCAATNAFFRIPWRPEVLAGFERLSKHSPAIMERWEAEFLRFRDRVLEIQPGIRVVIHDARHAELTTQENGGVGPFAQEELQRSRFANRTLARMAEFAANAFPGASVISPSKDTLIADHAHQWGHLPYHYIKPFYFDVARQLNEIAKAGVPAGVG